jgi:hypothetical protein
MGINLVQLLITLYATSAIPSSNPSRLIDLNLALQHQDPDDGKLPLALLLIR